MPIALVAVTLNVPPLSGLAAGVIGSRHVAVQALHSFADTRRDKPDIAGDANMQHHLAAQRHVRVSFDIPEYTGDVTGLGMMMAGAVGAIVDGGIRELQQGALSRVREFVREPEALFWTFLFPIVMSVVMAIAFPASVKTLYKEWRVGRTAIDDKDVSTSIAEAQVWTAAVESMPASPLSESAPAPPR